MCIYTVKFNGTSNKESKTYNYRVLTKLHVQKKHNFFHNSYSTKRTIYIKKACIVLIFQNHNKYWICRKEHSADRLVHNVDTNTECLAPFTLTGVL